jgi:rod shape-determining protein MreC
VFGQVTNVGPSSSEVILLSDAAHAIPVQISRNGLRTIATGTGDTRRLQLPYLPRNADVKAGDVLLTSGLGGVFPGGYPVGQVTEVKRDPSSPLAVVSAEPAAALDRNNEVLLVWFTPRVPTATPALATTPATTPAPGATGATATAGTATTIGAAATPNTATPAAPGAAPPANREAPR